MYYNILLIIFLKVFLLMALISFRALIGHKGLCVGEKNGIFYTRVADPLSWSLRWLEATKNVLEIASVSFEREDQALLNCLPTSFLHSL